MTFENVQWVSGDWIEFNQSVDSTLIPFNDYTLKLRLKCSASFLEVAASASTFAFKLELPAGNYTYQIIAVSGTKVKTLQSGMIEVTTGLASGVDEQTYALKMVTAIKASLLELASKPYTELEIKGRIVRYDQRTRGELLKELDMWQRMAGIKVSKSIEVVFI